MMEKTANQNLLAELAKVKATFQLRAIKAAMGIEDEKPKQCPAEAYSNASQGE